MKKITAIIIAFFMLTICTTSFGQIRKIPSAVTDSLAVRFPNAKNIEWGDRITVFEATFELRDHKYQASFNAEGHWKQTEKFLEEEEVPSAVTDGLEKSKYSDWEIKSYVEIHGVDGSHQYRLFARKNDLQKKYLYFSPDGRLIRETITL